MNKDNLRNKYLIIRNSINKNDKYNYDKIIYDKVIKLNEIINSKIILIYVSFGSEVDTINLIKYFLKINKLVAVPKVIDSKVMKFYFINSLNDLEKGYFDILEPTTNNEVTDFSNSICIVPAICYDKANNRIGYGKGYYDLFLRNHNIKTLGLIYKKLVIENIPITDLDIKIDYIITN